MKKKMEKMAREPSKWFASKMKKVIDYKLRRKSDAGLDLDERILFAQGPCHWPFCGPAMN